MCYDIFISYRRDDPDHKVVGGEALARNIKSCLESDWEFRVFMDQEAIHTGENWSEKIEGALSSAPTVVVVFCAHCLDVERDDDVFLREIRRALERKVKVIPVFMKDFNRRGMPSDLQFRDNAICCDHWDGTYMKLADQIGRSIKPKSELVRGLLFKVQQKAHKAVQDDGACDLKDPEFREILGLMERFGIPARDVHEVIRQQEEIFRCELRDKAPPSASPAAAFPSSSAAAAPPSVSPTAPATQPAVAAFGYRVAPTAVSLPPVRPARMSSHARKYMEDQEPALRAIGWDLLGGLPASVKYRHERNRDCMWFSNGTTAEFEVALRHRPRLHRLDVIFNAEPSEPVGDGTTYFQRLASSGGPSVREKYTDWPGDGRVCCALDAGSTPDQVESVRKFIAWFILDAPKLADGAQGTTQTDSTKESEDRTWGQSISRFARALILGQDDAPRRILKAIVGNILAHVTFYRSRESDWVEFFVEHEYREWRVALWPRPRAHRVDVVFYCDPGEGVRLPDAQGGAVVRYLKVMEQYGCPEPCADFKPRLWEGGPEISCSVEHDSTDAQLDAVRRYVEWYVLESPRLEQVE